MKNLKLKALSLGIVSTVLISSSAFAATNNAKQINKTSNNVATQTQPTLVKAIHPSFNYGPYGGPSAESIIDGGGVIQEGDVGQAVRDVQSRLHIEADGYFGSDTYNAVKTFQRNFDRVSRSNGHGSPLDIDGVVGPATWSVMR